MILYVAVTADEYELPLYVETSASALAKMLIAESEVEHDG